MPGIWSGDLGAPGRGACRVVLKGLATGLTVLGLLVAWAALSLAAGAAGGGEVGGVTKAADVAEAGPAGAGLLRWEEPTALVVVPPGRGAWYPRLLILPDGRWLAGYDTNVGAAHTYVQVAESTDGGRSWRSLSVASFGEGNAANASLALGPDGRVYLAYRLVRPGQYELRLSVSDDGGRTFRPLSVIARGVRGLWEPAIGWVGDELWAFYSTEEHAPWLPQAIGFRRSVDAGQTWEKEELVTHDPYSRDGMPAWAIQGDTVYLAFEATDLGNPFVIKLVTSPDRGRTWSAPRLVYQPAHPASGPVRRRWPCCQGQPRRALRPKARRHRPGSSWPSRPTRTTPTGRATPSPTSSTCGARTAGTPGALLTRPGRAPGPTTGAAWSPCPTAGWLSR